MEQNSPGIVPSTIFDQILFMFGNAALKACFWSVAMLIYYKRL